MAVGDVRTALLNPTSKQALCFDGSNDRATLPASVINTSAFTICFYFMRRETASTNDRFIDWQDAGPANGFTFVAPSGAEQKIQAVIRNDVTSVAAINSLDTLNSNQWYHVALAYAVNDVEFYIDGVSQGTDTTATMTVASALVTLGARYGGGNNANCAIRDLQIYNARLSGTQISNIINGYALPTSLAHSYKLDGNFTDSVGSTNGSLVNEAFYSTINGTVAKEFTTARAGATDKYLACEVNGKVLTAHIAET